MSANLIWPDTVIDMRSYLSRKRAGRNDACWFEECIASAIVEVYGGTECAVAIHRGNHCDVFDLTNTDALALTRALQEGSNHAID